MSEPLDPRLADLSRALAGRDKTGMRPAPSLQLVYATVVTTGAPLLVQMETDGPPVPCEASDAAKALPAGARVAVLIAGAGQRYAIGRVNP